MGWSRNILVVGVGGQGLITVGRILAEAALRAGENVLVAETHGMAQRGGSVFVHVRIGDVSSPLIPKGGANAVLGLECNEVLRALQHTNKETILLVNLDSKRPALPKVRPLDPTYVVDKLRELGLKVLAIDATRKAVELGDVRSANMVMVGALVATGVLGPNIGVEHVRSCVRGGVNLRAFDLGYSLAKELLMSNKWRSSELSGSTRTPGR